MDKANSASVIVVGGGVTGLSTAWWLAQRGVDVLVLEKSVIGREASGRNGGGAAHYYSPFFAEEQRLWQQLDEMLGYPTEFRPWRLAIAMTDEQADRNEKLIGISARLGKEAVRLDEKALRDRVPFVSDAARGATLFKFGGQANPQRTVQAYAWALQDLGGRILQHTEVLGFESAGGRVHAVNTTAGRFGCDHLVLACGPGTAPMARALGVEVPMALARVEMVVTAPVPLMRIGGTDGNGLYGRQTLRGNLAYGGGPHEWLHRPEQGKFLRPTTPLVQHIGKRLYELYPKLGHLRLIRSWAGIVENTPDGRPILDRLPGHDNVALCSMSSVGFGLSPASGRAMSELVLDGSCSFADISSFRISRFGNLPEDWREKAGWITPARTAEHA